MSDVELRAAERRWRADQTVESAREFVAMLIRHGPLADAAREGASAEARFIDAWRRADTEAAKAALAVLDGTPGHDRDAVERIEPEGVVMSPRREPCTARWRAPSRSAGELFVAGWLANLSAAERAYLWTHDVLSEPCITDEDRRHVSSRVAFLADLQVSSNNRSRALVETVTWAVCYIATSYLEGGPPSIERTFPRLVHGLLRRALVLDLETSDGSRVASGVLAAILEDGRSRIPSRPEIRLAGAQVFGVWGGASSEPAHPWHSRSLEIAGREIRDGYVLRGALAAFAAAPDTFGREARLAAVLPSLVPSARDDSTMAYALSNHLAPVLDRIDRALAKSLLEVAATHAWGEDASEDFASAAIPIGQRFDADLRQHVERALTAVAARGEGSSAITTFVSAALEGRDWPDWCVREGVRPDPANAPGPWLRELGPRLIRSLAQSKNDWARTRVTEMWHGRGPSHFTGLEDTWVRLARDPDPSVREVLRTGEIDW